jgi:2-dehydropantoate 2-reductase
MGLNVVAIQGVPAATWADADKGDVFEELDGFMSAHGGRVNWLASMAQDVYKGRRSEINLMNGLVAQKGREMAVPTPFNDAVIEVMNGIDDKTLEQSDAHVDRILKAVGQ